MEKRELYFVGDIHGELRTLVWTATQRYKIKDADLVVLGDFGVGFDKKIYADYARCKKRLIQNNLHIYTIRGNHDDPEYFDENSKVYKKNKKLFTRLHFLEDHKVHNIGGLDIYAIGGGGSTDIAYRTPGKSWWPGEYIKEEPIKELPGRVDVIVSHEAPLAFEPVVTRFDDTPEEQYNKIIEGRTYLDTVLQEVTCKNWYYGHYHKYYFGSYGDIIYRGLGIMEFYQHQKEDISYAE